MATIRGDNRGAATQEPLDQLGADERASPRYENTLADEVRPREPALPFALDGELPIHPY